MTATVSSISKYFEELVADLTDRVHRDPKTRLMNFRRFIEQLEAFLALEQRGHWSAVGLVDIGSFKWYNDTLGHALGDRIIDRVARLLREQVRSDDLIAQEAPFKRRPTNGPLCCHRSTIVEARPAHGDPVDGPDAEGEQAYRPDREADQHGVQHG